MLQQQFVAGVVVVEAALTCYAQLLVPTLQAAVAGLRRRPVHLAVVAGGAGAAVSLSLTLSLLRLKIGGSFDGHALNAAAAPS